MSEKKIYLVECISSHRMVYAIEAESKQAAIDTVEFHDELEEMGQQWIGQTVLSAHPVDQAEYLVQFDEINDYLKDIPLERKMSYVRLAQVNSGTENEG
jgi:hypothetical protein